MGSKDNGFLCVKYTFFVVNVIFWLLGCGVLGVGIWLLVAHGQFATLTPSFGFLSATSIIIAAGCVVLIVGFFGCCGSIMENQCMLVTYFVLVLIIFILEIAAGVFAFVNSGALETSIEKELRSGIRTKYGNENEDGLTAAWDYVQNSFSCCGVGNYSDWMTSKDAVIPDSCCVFPSVGCGKGSTSNLHPNGCLPAVKTWLNEKLVILGVVAVVVGVLQIMGMVAALGLCYCLRREKQYIA